MQGRFGIWLGGRDSDRGKELWLYDILGSWCVRHAVTIWRSGASVYCIGPFCPGGWDVIEFDSLSMRQGCRGLMVKASGWQSLDRQFEPYLRAFMAAPLWCGLRWMVEYIAPVFYKAMSSGAQRHPRYFWTWWGEHFSVCSE